MLACDQRLHSRIVYDYLNRQENGVVIVNNRFGRLVGVSTLILCGVIAGIPIGFILAPEGGN